MTAKRSGDNQRLEINKTLTFKNIYVYIYYVYLLKITFKHSTMGRKKTNRKVLSIRVDPENEAELKDIVREKDKELTKKKSKRND